MRLHRWLMVLVVLFGFAGWAGAQAVTAEDLTRLDAKVTDIRAQVDTLRKSDPRLATDVEQSVYDLSDEITYLRVKIRKQEPVSRADYASLNDRLETLRIRAQGQKVTAQPVLSSGAVPVGTQFDVRLQTGLNSGTARVEQRFEGTTVLDYAPDGKVVIPAGSVVRGFVSSVKAASKTERRGSLTLSFDQMNVGGEWLRLRASVQQALDGKGAQDNTRIGAGAIVGGIIGGILGGGKGALLGVLVGGGGTMAATDGADVDLPPGTILRLRLDEPLDVVAAPATPTGR